MVGADSTLPRNLDVQGSNSDVKALAEALQNYGFDCSNLQLLRMGTRDVYECASASLIVRVHNAETDPERIQRWNVLLERLEEQGALIVPPLRSEALRVGPDRWATLWPLGTRPVAPSAGLGAAVRSVHECSRLTGLPQWDPFPKIRQRLDFVNGLSVPTELSQTIAREAQRLDEERPNAARGTVIHGDAHAGNLVQLEEKARLIDLDDMSWGPPEVDLAPSVVASKRFSLSERDLEEFLQTAEPEMIDEPTLNWCCRVREMTMISWLATLWSKRPETRPELEWRLKTWRGSERWTPV